MPHDPPHPSLPQLRPEQLGVHTTQRPEPSQDPPGQGAPGARLLENAQTAEPLVHAIAPVVHGFPVLHAAPAEHGLQVPDPLHTPPGHADPVDKFPLNEHAAEPLEHAIAPVVHGFPVLHAAPVEHGLQVPAPLHTPPGHADPVDTLPLNVHTAEPLEHTIDPVVHGFPVPHAAPAEHGLQVPDPLHTPPGQLDPAG